MNCYIVKDLLPNYIDGMVSEETEKDLLEHLNNCDDCQMSYEKMKEPIVSPTNESNGKEINFLKRIRAKTRRNIAIVAAALIISFGALTWIFAIGTTASSEDVKVTSAILYQDNTYLNQQWVIDFELTNGKALNTKIVYTDEEDENGKIKKMGCVITLYEVQLSSLLAESTQFSYGYSLHGAEAPASDYDFTVTVRYKDKEVVYSMREEGLFD